MTIFMKFRNLFDCQRHSFSPHTKRLIVGMIFIFFFSFDNLALLS